MANINLLPWREERRDELKKGFLITLGGVAVIAVALVLLADNIVSGAVSYQQGRNQHLQAQIAELNLQVKEIDELQKKKQELLGRMKVIQNLQGNRPVIVRVFDELVKTLPNGVFYSELQRTGNSINLTGIAESNNRISGLMRRLDKSEWFSGPNLHSVNAKPKFGEQANEFVLKFTIGSPLVSEKGK